MIGLAVVGGGRMGSALAGGLVSARWALPEEIGVVEVDATRRDELVAGHPGVVVSESLATLDLRPRGGAVLAVKPDAVGSACRELKAAGVGRVLSVVAGMPSGRIEALLAEDSVVVRAMPNMPALIGKGMTAIAGGSRARSQDLEWAEGIASAVGAVVRLPEHQLEAVTGLSGSGPAYVYLVAEALIEAGVAVGLGRDLSRTLVVETLLGSATLLAQTGELPEALRAAVTSPGGTTAAGLRILESKAVRSALIEAVLGATERARNLAR